MKRILSLFVLGALLGGCVVVPVGRYDDNAYRRGYYRGDGYYRYDESGYRRGYYRGDGYHPRYDDAYYGYRGIATGITASEKWHRFSGLSRVHKRGAVTRRIQRVIGRAWRACLR